MRIDLRILARVGLASLALAGVVVPQMLWSKKHNATPARGNLDRQACDAIADRPPAATGSPPYFADVTDDLRIDFEDAAGPLGTYFLPEVNGAGGALFDYDGDGDLDLFFVGCGRSPAARGSLPEGARPGNRLYRRESDGTFTDVTQGSGLEGEGHGAGCAVADIDNDGDLDLYVTDLARDRLYRNNGNGTFTEIGEAAGIHENDYGTSAAFFDYDRDGWLDLVVANYVHDPAHGLSVACTYENGQVTYCAPDNFIATDARLLHNDGPVRGADGQWLPKFSDVTSQAGLSKVPGAGFAVVCADFNGDRLSDIYIANDLNPNRLWINLGNGSFVDEAVVRGAAYNGKGAVESCMGIAIGDVNNDGAIDLLTSHFIEEIGTLHLNDGSGHFIDATEAAGIAGPTLRHTGWGAAFVDLDHDGYVDLAIVNGAVFPCHLLRRGVTQRSQEVRHDLVTDARAFWAPYADRNLLLINRGTGRFEDQSDRGGEFSTTLGSARALICGDIDDDGDIDLVVTCCGGRARVFRNDVPKRGRWLQVRVVDAALHRDAYGAEVVVEAGGRRFHRLASPASSYLASHDPRLHFGLGNVDRYDAVTVHWPDGSVETFSGGLVDRLVILERGTGNFSSKGEP